MFSPILFFIVIFLLGISLYQDYGISLDEKFHRENALFWYNYSKGFILAYPEDPFIYYPLQIEYQEQTIEERLKHWKFHSNHLYEHMIF